ncbi:MAG TPA: DEAD/DEAH box helicase, partial [Pirellulales bacterium]|nr:DEAD/DEAH box helicase [Pirellulales bacterium]
MPISLFHPITAHWFVERFGQPTEPQRLGWPEIIAGRNTLIAAPTGSGKTLAAFLASIDCLLRQALEGQLTDETQVVYISPLKALSNDVRRNLETPLAQIRQYAAESGHELPPLRAMVRTGDTPSSERAKMLKQPPHILVTTPESLYLLLTAAKGREMLRHVRTVIVDEIHALARDKRGSHLTLSLQRLAALCPTPPVRIGLSATQRPIEEIARFLVGSHSVTPSGEAACSIVDVGHVRELDLAVEVPPSELSAVCSHETWAEIYQRLTELVMSHRSTLVFVNTRRMAERVCYRLSELLGENAVASHHGSLSRELRLSAEQRLQAGELKAIVATASLELGIDIGYIDLVCQIGSPRSIATFLQRVGRAGHSLGALPKGRLFALTRDELIESLALIRAVRHGRLDKIEIPQAPFDILAQQIVAAVAGEEWCEDELFDLCCGAWPYRNLGRDEYNAVLEMLSEGIGRGRGQGAYLHRDRIHRRLRPRRGARIAAITSGGAIPELADYRVVTVDEGTFVGTLNEDFAIESQAGDIFLLGNMSWRIVHVRGGEVVVQDAHAAPASVPFWLGEAPGRTFELAEEVSELRRELADRVEERKAEEDRGARSAECGAEENATVELKEFEESVLRETENQDTER